MIRGAMATNPFDNPGHVTGGPGTAVGFGQRFATFLAAGNSDTPYIDFTH